jgi:hypothetical protein
LLHADSIQLSRFLLKTKDSKNSTNLLAGEQGVMCFLVWCKQIIC